MKELCRIEKMSIDPIGMGNGIYEFDIILNKGEVWKIFSDMQDDAHILLKSFATLNVPKKGKYVFKGCKLDFSDYRNLLSSKRTIGYIAPDSSLVRNKTVRENLNMSRWYYLNTLSPTLDTKTAELCTLLGINSTIDKRPTDLIAPDQRTAVAVRELARAPELLLLERPVEFVGLSISNFFTKIVSDMVEKGMTVVFYSDDKTFLSDLVCGEIHINNGQLSIKRY